MNMTECLHTEYVARTNMTLQEKVIFAVIYFRLRIHIIDLKLNLNKFKYVVKIYIKCMFPVMFALGIYNNQCSIHVKHHKPDYGE